METPAKPLFIWDGECGFCRAWMARLRRATGDRVEYAPYQEVAARFPEVPLEKFRAAAQLIETDGRWSEGAEAMFRALACVPGRGWPLALYQRMPGFGAASRWCYSRVARNRGTLSWVTLALWGNHVVPPGEALTAWIFMRLLGVVYACAFVSMWTQIVGLVGARGILPARELLEAVRTHYGAAGMWLVPTVSWLGASDGALIALCAAGTALAALLIAGIAPAACAAGAWLLYLSIASVGQDFMWFQWDSLLLEAGFLAIFIAPWRWTSHPHRAPAPSRAALWLLRWLVFRLMFSSAAVKLGSGDPAWRHLTALTFHYETQPLPPWTAWYAHHLPAAFQRMSAAVMFAVEGLAPFFIFAPRRLRFMAAAAMVMLQVLILVTGNYGFFNLISIALCVLLVDDVMWPSHWGGAAAARDPRDAGARRVPRWLVRGAAVAMFALTLVPLFRVLQLPAAWLGPVRTLHELVAPLRIADSYGLFAVMTTRRPEIEVEGSADGVTWTPYRFAFKIGDLARRPRFVAPHMPRLDWQMWFAAIGDFRRETWFLRFCERLLQGSPPVLALLERNPFPQSPPRFVRAVVYDYHFTDARARRASGAWWRREPLGLYCPVLTLERGRLAAVREPGAP
jgi:predicted DCC family thiol-disulfide oxidoreductase YuxK